MIGLKGSLKTLPFIFNPSSGKGQKEFIEMPLKSILDR